ncbi:hypothetical protein [Pseudooceanicola onchidii]|uniref:hypothetical protein n=1 Tax=Pseudooceanicola onchidii TaxID=2562279 RepID=UPI0010AB389A|nr:hypothetical protein [Pseudooceanicola onchidii]
MSDLDHRLLSAHAGADPAVLAGLYQEAAHATGGDAGAFYLTHAFVFALEAGLPDAALIEADLRALGRV